MSDVNTIDYPVFSVSNLEDLLNNVAVVKPERIDHAYLVNTLGLTEKNAGALYAGLCALGFIEDDGRLTADGRLAVSEEDRPAAFSRSLDRVYAEMLIVLLYDEEFTMDLVHCFLEGHTELRLSGRQKVATVFKYLLFNSDREDLKARFSHKKCFA